MTMYEKTFFWAFLESVQMTLVVDLGFWVFEVLVRVPGCVYELFGPVYKDTVNDFHCWH